MKGLIIIILVYVRFLLPKKLIKRGMFWRVSPFIPPSLEHALVSALGLGRATFLFINANSSTPHIFIQLTNTFFTLREERHL